MPETFTARTTVHCDELVEALGMSHGDLANLLRNALKAEYPGPQTWVWTRDVYDDRVVYSVETNDQTVLYQRSYSVLDGAVTFGDAVEVIPVTNYVAVGESDRDGLTERSFTQDQRDAMAKSGMAMADGSYPIETKGDLRNAIAAYGRGSNKAAVKKHIIKRAKALGVTSMLPADWQESERQPVLEGVFDELTSDLVPLVERAVKDDGTIAIRIIAPGQGSSGYYSADVLKRDGPKVFTEGLHMYADHPTVTEETDRPERSIKDLIGKLTSDARWEDEGSAGPGLYAEAKIRGDVAPLIEDLAPSIGVSIRALGKASKGEVDGKQTTVVESIDQAKSVDFVTVPGAGGCVVDLMESARQRREPTEDDDVSKEELEEAQKKIADLEAKIEAQERREAEAKLIVEARGVLAKALAPIALAEVTKARLTESLLRDVPVKDDALDAEALIAKATEAAKAEAAYIAAVAGNGKVIGMGATVPADGDALPTLEESEKRIEAAITGW